MWVEEKDGYRLLREIVAERPDWVDPDSVRAAEVDDGVPDDGGCVYVHRDADDALQPSCVVGVWLHRLGADVSLLEGGSQAADGALIATAVRTTETLQQLLMVVQRLQDDRVPWGAALDAAPMLLLQIWREQKVQAAKHGTPAVQTWFETVLQQVAEQWAPRLRDRVAS